ncbi:hypothetical protein TWF730_008968 [Orbilia blumenaviensis]|uniref:F-box domain-containing protein n=1 Tax=Orbilia blumenaviensis TaxID=1796055 RepID=A0AAV9V0A0_9PEZI
MSVEPSIATLEGRTRAESGIYLPLEIVWLIAQHIADKRTLSRFCRTCRMFNSSSQAALYETLEIEIDTDTCIDSQILVALLWRNHSGLKYVRNLIVSGTPKNSGMFDPRSNEVQMLFKLGAPHGCDNLAELLGEMEAPLDLAILCILRNIPLNILRSFIWNSFMELSDEILELLCENQQSLEGFFIDMGDGDEVRAIDFKPPRNLKHVYINDIEHGTRWIEYAFRMVQPVASNLETLSLTMPLLRFMREDCNTKMGLPRGSRTTLSSSEEGIVTGWASFFLNSEGFGPPTRHGILFPNLGYLSVSRFGPEYFKPWLGHALNASTLHTLKLDGYHGVPQLTLFLKEGGFRLKVFHLTTRDDEGSIEEVLAWFNSLEELYLDHVYQEDSVTGKSAISVLAQIAHAISGHGGLRRLVWDPQFWGEGDPPDMISTARLRALCATRFPKLEELGIQESLRKLQVVWVMPYDGRPSLTPAANLFTAQALFSICPRVECFVSGHGRDHVNPKAMVREAILDAKGVPVSLDKIYLRDLRDKLRKSEFWLLGLGDVHIPWMPGYGRTPPRF